jgi:hypothetical protein
MVVEIVSGIDAQPVRIEATQVVVRMGNGSPVAAAVSVGPDGMVAVGIAGDEVKEGQFKKVLRYCGIIGAPEVDKLNLSNLK